jgi:hypothetical protein
VLCKGCQVAADAEQGVWGAKCLGSSNHRVKFTAVRALACPRLHRLCNCPRLLLKGAHLHSCVTKVDIHAAVPLQCVLAGNHSHALDHVSSLQLAASA